MWNAYSVLALYYILMTTMVDKIELSSRLIE